MMMDPRQIDTHVFSRETMRTVEATREIVLATGRRAVAHLELRGARVDFSDLRVGDEVASIAPSGDLLAHGHVVAFIECKDHVRAVDVDRSLVARSDYPHIYRIGGGR